MSASTHRACHICQPHRAGDTAQIPPKPKHRRHQKRSQTLPKPCSRTRPNRRPKRRPNGCPNGRPNLSPQIKNLLFLPPKSRFINKIYDFRNTIWAGTKFGLPNLSAQILLRKWYILLVNRDLGGKIRNSKNLPFLPPKSPLTIKIYYFRNRIWADRFGDKFGRTDLGGHLGGHLGGVLGVDLGGFASKVWARFGSVFGSGQK